MSLINTWFFTKTIIDWDKIAKATHNQYKCVSCRNFIDKKGVLNDGYTLTLMVVQDNFDYGVDKNGKPRENNVYQNFDVTLLCKKQPIKKGDTIRLLEFNQEYSYAINFDMILRFNNYEVLQNQTTNTMRQNA